MLAVVSIFSSWKDLQRRLVSSNCADPHWHRVGFGIVGPVPPPSTQGVLTREGRVVRGLSCSRSPLSHLNNLMFFSREVWESCWGKRVQLMIDLDREVKLVLARGEVLSCLRACIT